MGIISFISLKPSRKGLLSDVDYLLKDFSDPQSIRKVDPRISQFFILIFCIYMYTYLFIEKIFRYY